MTSDPYLYESSEVLRNRLNIRDAEVLDVTEREIVLQRAAEGSPTGRFDLSHLRAIHKHLFQDVYDWAGQVRTVEINKGGSQFQFRDYIETGMADIHRRLEKANFLRGLSREDFAKAAGEIIGDVNYVHPFREGNGRTQAEYLRQLGDRAGHPIDLAKLDKTAWIEASRAAHRGDYAPMAAEIFRCTEERARDKGLNQGPRRFADLVHQYAEERRSRDGEEREIERER